MLDAVCENPPARQQGAPFPVFGRVIGDAHDDGAYEVGIHRAAERPLERIVAEGNAGIAMRRVDEGPTQFGEVADLHLTPGRPQIGEGTGLHSRIAVTARNVAGIADARGQQGDGVLVRHQVPLDAVEARL